MSRKNILIIIFDSGYYLLVAQIWAGFNIQGLGFIYFFVLSIIFSIEPNSIKFFMVVFTFSDINLDSILISSILIFKL